MNAESGYAPVNQSELRFEKHTNTIDSIARKYRSAYEAASDEYRSAQYDYSRMRESAFDVDVPRVYTRNDLASSRNEALRHRLREAMREVQRIPRTMLLEMVEALHLEASAASPEDGKKIYNICSAAERMVREGAGVNVYSEENKREAVFIFEGSQVHVYGVGLNESGNVFDVVPRVLKWLVDEASDK